MAREQSTPAIPPSDEDLLLELARYEKDPLGFVMFAFPWGEPGTPLEKMQGPEKWQRDLLTSIGRKLQNKQLVVLEATASGHGIGKSACSAWLTLWAQCTLANTKGVVTANTENQLKTKTWAEVAKWFGMFIGNHLFDLSATSLSVKTKKVEEKSTWKIDMVPWSERNTEAFAGLHNQGNRVFLMMDEASAIPDAIHEVAEGALTDENTQIIFVMFGNPTRNKGRFRDAFPGGRFEHRWTTRRVDSREVSFTNKTQIKNWEEDYGDDSDFFRIRVKGEFPRVDAESFISFELARLATLRRPEQIATPENPFARPGIEPLVIGVDVGRFGDDPSVIFFRRGADAVSLPPEVYFQLDTMSLAGRISALYIQHSAAAVMVDSGGVGGGVVDRLRQLGVPVLEVDFGSKPTGTNPDDGARYANKRAEIWGALRSWLGRGCIPSEVAGLEVSMVEELTAPQYSLNAKEAIILESKKDMRSRGIKSPNLADALACTFAYPVYYDPADRFKPEETSITEDYNPFSRERMLV